MKYTVCILLFCTLFLVNNVHSLSGGTNVIAGTHPSHALVLVATVPRGGTIVNVNHVVTSCTVVLDEQQNLRAIGQFQVRSGSVSFTEGTTTTVTAVFPHPECNPWTQNNDVAVLRTTANFAFDANLPNPNVAPAVFNERVIADATECLVVGFNAPPAGGTSNLQELVVPILNRNTQCNAANAHNGRMLQSMFCAGSMGAGSGICDATIGGGVYCNGNFTGIASFGTGCGAANNPGVFIQVRHHIQWITAQFTRTQIPAAGPTPPPGVAAGMLTAVTSSLLLCLGLLFTRL